MLCPFKKIPKYQRSYDLDFWTVEMDDDNGCSLLFSDCYLANLISAISPGENKPTEANDKHRACGGRKQLRSQKVY